MDRNKKGILRHYEFVSEQNKIIFKIPLLAIKNGSFSQEQILIITNITAGKIIYSPQISGYGGILENNVLILEQDTTSMSKFDVLQIFFEEHLINFEQERNEETIRTNSLLSSMYDCLKRIEKHLENMTDEEITEKDIINTRR